MFLHVRLFTRKLKNTALPAIFNFSSRNCATPIRICICSLIFVKRARVISLDLPSGCESRLWLLKCIVSRKRHMIHTRYRVQCQGKQIYRIFPFPIQLRFVRFIFCSWSKKFRHCLLSDLESCYFRPMTFFFTLFLVIYSLAFSASLHDKLDKRKMKRLETE